MLEPDGLPAYTGFRSAHQTPPGRRQQLLAMLAGHGQQSPTTGVPGGLRPDEPSFQGGPPSFIGPPVDAGGGPPDLIGPPVQSPPPPPPAPPPEPQPVSTGAMPAPPTPRGNPFDGTSGGLMSGGRSMQASLAGGQHRPGQMPGHLQALLQMLMAHRGA